ncbi:MAG: UDP-glucose dehydrogenase family protein [Candidatus Methanofastidiosia archaeon]
MRISIVGAGYVGLATGVVFASLGHQIFLIELDFEKVKKIRKGIPPMFERNLEEFLRKTRKNLHATTDHNIALKTEMSFLCVQTPSLEDGSIDLSSMKIATEQLSRALRDKKDYHLIVVKSTVTPMVTEEVLIPLIEKYSEKKVGSEIGVCTNPEFLQEGRAIEGTLKPSRIVLGEFDERSGDTLLKLYREFSCPIMRCSLKTAEMIKYASNCMLATKISFINEIGNLCKLLGIDVYDVAKGVGLDERINPQHLNAGIGFGGSCFPKDVKAFVRYAESRGYTPKILKEVLNLNESQPLRLLELLKKKIGNLEKERIGVLGLAFKKNTDDVRDAVSLKILGELLRQRALVYAYDPKAMERVREIFGNRINYCKSANEVLKKCDYILIVTEWEEFKDLDYSQKYIFDGRYLLKDVKCKYYEGVCW